MAAGALRARVSIERPVTAPDGYGGQAVSWAAAGGPVWAEVRPVKGREVVADERLASVRTFLVILRHRTDVDVTMRVRWGGLLMNIRSAENRDQRKRYLTLECETELGA